jgi:hypothetical protein
MFVLPFLLYTYMNQQNFSNYINTTTIADWTPQWFTQTHWASPTQWSSPSFSLPSTPDMNQYAFFYFLSGAIFFLGSSYMVLSATREPNYALDGIATMSDFTKTNVMNYMKDHKPNRELIALLESNGMDAEEFLNIFAGKNKRPRRVSTSS